MPPTQKTDDKEKVPDIKTVTSPYVKIKMNVTSATPDAVMDAGKVYRVPRAQAEELINGNYANLTNEDVYDPG